MERISENLDYIPMNSKTVKEGMSFGPIEFRIKPESHKHHLDYLSRENGSLLYSFPRDFLFPFEMFSLPRVLSIPFKKLNEALSIRCDRLIYRLPKPDELLHADAFIDAVFIKKGLCLGYFTSRTFGANNELLMKSIDKVLLINGSNLDSVRRTIINAPPVTMNSISSTEFISSFVLRFRHTWDESLWINNIHTDKYAQYVGFERGLIEAPAFIDVLLSNIKTGFLLKEGIRVNWRYHKPLYRNLQVSLGLIEGKSGTQLLVYESENSQTVMTVKVQKL